VAAFRTVPVTVTEAEDVVDADPKLFGVPRIGPFICASARAANRKNAMRDLNCAGAGNGKSSSSPSETVWNRY
jgi:hypothetical protein